MDKNSAEVYGGLGRDFDETLGKEQELARLKADILRASREIGGKVDELTAVEGNSERNREQESVMEGEQKGTEREERSGREEQAVTGAVTGESGDEYVDGQREQVEKAPVLGTDLAGRDEKTVNAGYVERAEELFRTEIDDPYTLENEMEKLRLGYRRDRGWITEEDEQEGMK